MEENGQQSVSPKPTQDRADLTTQSVIQPTEVANREPQSTQPLKPSVVVSQFEPDSTVQSTSKQEALAIPAIPSISEKDAVPIGMSASQLGLDTPRRHFHFGLRRNFRSGVYPVAVLLVVVGGLLFWKYYVDGMATKTYTAGDYTYSYTFFRSAKFEHFPNGMQGYMLGQAEASAFIGPTVDNPEYCAELGVAYTQAFTVQMYGFPHNVCKAHDDLNNQIYAVNFSTQSKNFGFVIDYPVSQNAKVYPKLKSIFESVRVSK